MRGILVRVALVKAVRVKHILSEDFVEPNKAMTGTCVLVLSSIEPGAIVAIRIAYALRAGYETRERGGVGIVPKGLLTIGTQDRSPSLCTDERASSISSIARAKAA